jgi:2-amino-4-hydroxy-6-hydroxymethyldihydropteridine diphosphokinase
MTDLAFISLGSNIAPEDNLPMAVERLKELGRLVAISSVYQSPAVGPVRQEDFLNAAALIETELRPLEIRAKLRQIEADLGRVRPEKLDGYPAEVTKYAPRAIDLDLCLLGGMILDKPDLTLPDPDLLTRAHLAVPLAELAPDLPHPITGEPLQTIADRLRHTVVLNPRADVAERLKGQAQHRRGE